MDTFYEFTHLFSQVVTDYRDEWGNAYIPILEDFERLVVPHIGITTAIEYVCDFGSLQPSFHSRTLPPSALYEPDLTIPHRTPLTARGNDPSIEGTSTDARTNRLPTAQSD